MDMGKKRQGSIVKKAGKLYVRVAYTDQLGRRRELMRRAQNRKHAQELKKQLVKDLDSAKENPRAELDAQKLTFAKVAAAYESVKLIEAQWITASPFEAGEPLICAADEAKRDRTLSRDEEERLLLALSGKYAHLLPLRLRVWIQAQGAVNSLRLPGATLI